MAGFHLGKLSSGQECFLCVWAISSDQELRRQRKLSWGKLSWVETSLNDIIIFKVIRFILAMTFKTSTDQLFLICFLISGHSGRSYYLSYLMFRKSSFCCSLILSNIPLQLTPRGISIVLIGWRILVGSGYLASDSDGVSEREIIICHFGTTVIVSSFAPPRQYFVCCQLLG